MATDGHSLPQLGGELFLTDGGIETCLIYHEGLDLPLFAAFDLLKDDAGTETLRRYFRCYLEVARRAGTGFVFESPTWRASRDWGERLGYSAAALAAANRSAMALGAELRREFGNVNTVLSGCVGPRGDGYRPEALMTGKEAHAYHAEQIEALAEGGAEMVTAITMTHAGEAVGIARAAKTMGLPVAISFTVETDGSLPSGQALAEAIADVDAATDGAPAYYMINCAHPTHFADKLAGGGGWTATHPRPAGQRVALQPRRARRGDRARRRRSRGVRRAVCRAAPAAAAASGARRLLRHRPSPCRGHRARLRPNVAHRGRCLVCAQLLLRRSRLVGMRAGRKRGGIAHATDHERRSRGDRRRGMHVAGPVVGGAARRAVSGHQLLREQRHREGDELHAAGDDAGALDGALGRRPAGQGARALSLVPERRGRTRRRRPRRRGQLVESRLLQWLGRAYLHVRTEHGRHGERRRHDRSAAGTSCGRLSGTENSGHIEPQPR